MSPTFDPQREHLSFVPLAREHLALLAEWLRTPHVAEWWPDLNDLASVEAKYSPMVEGSDTTEGFLIVVGDLGPKGFIQRYRIADEPSWAAALERAIGERQGAGIDYFIGDAAMVGLGLGSEAIRRFVELLWTSYPEVNSVVVAVQQRNVASWRALERAGFERVWSGLLDTDDPSDQGPAFLLKLPRPTGTASHTQLCGPPS